ncbi:DUF998 domain-containing protein [Kineosporia sp. J2-2]|uniref:DUF998 domain-containing protein n=1 Tax=Kineosporia corallincola TaxID=2835133 RepID=A0ABS5TRH5_9ACTN|nr:DUF998 domain-containing protein [Kineosporia corallincola]MBT0773398.1 DUF998 domain-containing protein [Kineosporia corallincola]
MAESMTIALAGISLFGLLGYLGVMGYLHRSPTGYDPLRHAVSDYGVGPYRRWFTAAAAASSVGTYALAGGLAVTPGFPPLATEDLVYLLLIPLTRAGVALFPTDLEGDRATRSGRLHYLFAIAQFTLIYLAVADLTGDLGVIDPWSGFSGVLTGLRWVVTVSLVLLVLALLARRVPRLAPLTGLFGLWERGFLFGVQFWFVAVAVGLLAAGV